MGLKAVPGQMQENSANGNSLAKRSPMTLRMTRRASQEPALEDVFTIPISVASNRSVVHESTTIQYVPNLVQQFGDEDVDGQDGSSLEILMPWVLDDQQQCIEGEQSSKARRLATRRISAQLPKARQLATRKITEQRSEPRWLAIGRLSKHEQAVLMSNTGE